MPIDLLVLPVPFSLRIDLPFFFAKGYYIDVGCSQLIIDGKVKIKQGQEIERFEKTSVRFKDGSFLEADVVVLATGTLYCFLSHV